MSDYTVTLLPSNQLFQVKKDEVILDAAIRQGIDVAYTCRNGTCRTCLCQVIYGQVVPHDVELCMISEQELSKGRVLLCMSSLKTDAIIEKVTRIRKKKNKQ